MKYVKETNMPKPVHGRWYGDACGAAFGMELLGERWTILILRELMFGPRRFSDLRAELPGITAKVLTERLTGMEATGILCRVTLTDPVPAQLYQLTSWGEAAETILQEIGRWAAASPLHDPTLPLSAASFMMSLRTMLDRDAAQGIRMVADFRIGTAHFATRLEGGELTVRRGIPDAPDLSFAAKTASDLAAVFYGDAPPDTVGVRTENAHEDIARFVRLFRLPPKIAAHCECRVVCS